MYQAGADSTISKKLKNITMKQTHIDPSQVKGWGIDADPGNDPTYPMKNRNNSEHAGYSWDRPVQQPVDIEILHSNERPDITATFGTSSPPSGLSGVLRRIAFRYSESNYGHWLPLILADRIGVVEGVMSDIVHGRFPNIVRELGWKVEWKYNRKSLLTRILVGTTVVGVIATSIVVGYQRRTS
jgi:hypothetical protein